MKNAKVEAMKHEIRLCPSILNPNRACRFGDKCRAEHSIENYIKTKPEDIG